MKENDLVIVKSGDKKIKNMELELRDKNAIRQYMKHIRTFEIR